MASATGSGGTTAGLVLGTSLFLPDAKATGLEALFGALYLSGKQERINELFNILMEDGDTQQK